MKNGEPMKVWRHVYIDFAQPQRAWWRAWWHLRAALVLGVLTLVVAAVEITSDLRDIKAPVASEVSRNVTTADPSVAEQIAQRWLANDLSFLQRSIERTLPAGVVLLSVSASQESGEITLSVQSSSAEKILALPTWLHSGVPDDAKRRWKIEQLSGRASPSNVLTGVLSCSHCWTPIGKDVGQPDHEPQ